MIDSNDQNHSSKSQSGEATMKATIIAHFPRPKKEFSSPMFPRAFKRLK
jgi:hypothetical protein